MIRPFDLRDISLMRKLACRGVALDGRTALTRDHQPLRDAMLAYLIASRGTPTYVLHRPGERAFGQVQMHANRPLAQLVALASHPDGSELSTWPLMLDALTTHAGRCGAHAVVADVEDTGDGFQALRQADFVTYTRQEVWQLTAPAGLPERQLLRPERPEDQWPVQQLIANTVPRLIQQVEAAKPNGPGLVWVQESSALAYVSAHCGPRGTWVQLYFHPQAEESAGAILQQAAAHYAPTPERPLYCCVRRYQGWLGRPLAELSFELVRNQAVMVRHTTIRLAQPELQLTPVREKGLEATTPIVQAQEHKMN